MRYARRRTAGVALSGVWGCVIALLTLAPGDPHVPALSSWCLVCGHIGTADMILNTVLFIPLGAGFGMVSRTAVGAVGAGAAVSAGIEVAQLFIPGRNATAGDLVANTVGMLAGAVLATSWRSWLQPLPARETRLHAAWTILSVGLFAVVAWLFTPALPITVWHGRWAADLGYVAAYTGRVLSAQLGGQPVRADRLEHPEQIRQALLAGTDASVTIIAGPPPPRLASILSIIDQYRGEILLVGARHDDVIVRYATAASSMRLRNLELSVKHGFARFQPGDTADITVRWHHPVMSISIESALYRRAPDIADAIWLLIAPPRDLPGSRTALRGLWLALLFFPLGFWGDRRLGACSRTLAVVAALAAAPLFLPIGGLPTRMFGAVGIGILAGVFARSYCSRKRRPGMSASTTTRHGN